MSSILTEVSCLTKDMLEVVSNEIDETVGMLDELRAELATTSDDESNLMIDEAPVEECFDSSDTEIYEYEAPRARPTRRIPLGCGRCEQPLDLRMLVCDRCDHSIHYTCASIPDSQAARVLNFYCDNCEALGERTVWREERPNRRQLIDKKKNYFEVEKILDHKYIGQERHFLIKWKGYSARYSTWEREKNLDGCLNLLQNYLRSKGLRASGIIGLLGSSATGRHDQRNWVTMEECLATIQRLKRKSTSLRSVEVTIDIWENKKDGCDGLYLFRHHHHVYIILYVRARNLGYIADGGNLFRTDLELANDIREITEMRLISVAFNYQSKIDHCGSSAIMIALEMLRCYKLQMRPQNLVPNKSTYRIIRKTMHKYESKREKIPVGRDNFPRCHNCKRGFRSRVSLANHIRKCNKMVLST